MLFLAGVEGRYIYYIHFPHVQKTLTSYSSVRLLLLLYKELGVEYIASFFFWWRTLEDLVDVPTACGEVVRDGCLFAWNFGLTMSTVLTRGRED